MILYHYSVDSYHGDASLINDYANHYRFTEPLVLALEKGRAAFDAAYCALMYVSRELTALKLRKFENYRKDAVEAIFEYVRKTEFPDAVGRQKCVYYCATAEEARRYAHDDCLDSGDFAPEQVQLLTVEAEDSRIRRYDQTFFNRAMEVIDRNDIEAVFPLAQRYYSGEISETPLTEILCDGRNRVLKAEPI